MIIKKMSKKGAVLARLAVIIFLAGLFSVFNPAEALAYPVCLGVGFPDPNSSICPNDWDGLTDYTQNQLVTKCTDARKCEYTCNNGYIFVNHFGILSCSPDGCNSSTSCDTMWNDNGTNKYCRKMGNDSNAAWNWVPEQTCTSNNFCQTYQCGTSTVSPERGYCGIKSDETFDWVNSGSASCPYSISVNRNQSEYQLTASCAANDTGCQTASVSVKVTSSNNVTGPNAAAVAKNLHAARMWNNPISRPSQICFTTYSGLKMLDMSPTWWLSGSTFTWHDYRDGTKTTLPIDNEMCTIECSGEPGYYSDRYYISNFFIAVNEFSINCTPPTAIIPPAYVCTGTLPAANATMFAGDNIGLTANTPYTYSATNTAAKCEYYLTSTLPPCACATPAESCNFPSTPCGLGNATPLPESEGKFNWTCSDPAVCTGTATCSSLKGNPDVPVSSCTNLDTISCSKSCGGGTKTETCQNHDCSSTTRSISCNSQSCPPGYKEVAPW